MRRFGLLLVLMLVFNTAHGQTENDNYAEKVATLDATIQTLYGVISGEKGEARNWELFKYLFHPEAKLIFIHRKLKKLLP